MIAEWASIYIIYDASITLFEKAWTWHEVPVPNHLMETESEFAPWDLSKAHILVSTPAQLGRTLVARWQYNFNSGILASGKTRMALKTSKTTTTCWLASNSTNMPAAIKCQINNEKSQIFPNTNLDRLGEKWALPTTSQLHLFCTRYMISTQDRFKLC